MTKRVKSVTAHVVKSHKQITFRAVVTILEVIAAVLVALPPELISADKIATAAAIGGLISIIVNILKESGLFENVRYSFADDYYKKTDIQVQHKGKWYAVGLMLASKRSFLNVFSISIILCMCFRVGVIIPNFFCNGSPCFTEIVTF